MHQLFKEVADDLNSKGVTQRMLAEQLKNYAEIPNTLRSMKAVWQMIELAMFFKDSTAAQTKQEVKEVWDVFERVVLAPYQSDIKFPSYDNE